MIFSRPNLTFRVLDVLSINQKNVKNFNKDRHFCAISFRKNTNAVISCNGKEFKMSKGSVSFFPADVDYYRTAGVDDMIVVHLEVMNYYAGQIETVIAPDYDKAEKLFTEMYSEWSKNKKTKYYTVTSLLYIAFSDIFEYYMNKYDAALLPAASAAEYISLNFKNPTLTVPQIAKAVNVSEVYLRRIFKEKYKMSPKKYITDMRIKHAASLLASGYFSVSEAAHIAGFEDEKYFSSVFKKNMGCSPSKYVYSYTP